VVLLISVALCGLNCNYHHRQFSCIFIDIIILMLIRILLFIIFLTLFITADAQNIQPLELAKKIFSPKAFPDINKYVTGEYKGRPNGTDLRKGTMTRFLLLGQTSNTAVVDMTVTDSSGDGFDTYLHFKKDSIWKMEAFRALAQTTIIEQVKQELESLTPQQVDSIISIADTARNKESLVFTSREDYEFELGNARLTLALDEKIIAHFKANEAAFNKIKDSILLVNKNIDDDKYLEIAKGIKQSYRKLFISSVTSSEVEFGKSINFLIGGIIDNSVGYLFVMDKKSLPEMSSDRIIMLREIGNGWYIYKTT
ncbi:MAG: hypothetical protein ABI480_01265, partial [Chitinophagaceae bacterium]